MSRKIYIYQAIESLYNHPKYNEIKQVPHITATSGLYRAMRSKYSEVNQITDVHALLDCIVGTWEENQTVFSQYITISRIIRKMRVTDDEVPIHNSFIKNRQSVLNSIRLLVEADIYPDQLDCSNLEERMFKAIWLKLEEEESSFGWFRASFAAYLLDQTALVIQLEKKLPDLSSSRIVLHGFYFITPIQERLFDILEKAGKELIFLCCVDSRYPEVTEIWHKTLSPSNKFESIESWISSPEAQMNNQSFGSVFSMKPTSETQNNVKIIKYTTEMDFVVDTERLRSEGYTIYTTDTKSTENLLKEFYPEIYKRRHLLSYPIGQYIYRIHSMWNSKSEQLELCYDDVQVCFASGWLEVNGVNARKHMRNLEKLKTYVLNCRTIDEWESRFRYLQEIKSGVLSAFEDKITNVPKQNMRWHRIMSNPFLNFSCFSLNESELGELVNLLRHLIDTARELFSESSEVDIGTHLEKLQRMLNANNFGDEMLEEEQLIIKELSSRLRFTSLGTMKCMPGEIAEAIKIIVGGGILDSDTYSVLAMSDDTFVKPLYQIESSPITGNGKVHLCLADETRLPGNKRQYVWPLNSDMLDRIHVGVDERRFQYIKDMRFILENSALANRYLFFSLLQNPEVEISWISSENRVELIESPYIQMIDALYDTEIINRSNTVFANECIVKAKAAAENDELFEVALDADIPSEAYLDLMLCHWRYIYSYILSEYPSFYSDFHYSFATSNLIGAFSKTSEFNKETIASHLYELFPNFRDIEKRQALDFVPNNLDVETDEMDNISYSRTRLHVHFLNRKQLTKAVSKLNSQLNATTTYSANKNTTASNNDCMYCPFQATCPHATHVAEKETL